MVTDNRKKPRGHNRQPRQATLPARIIGAVALFVILEPIWMLLPFAGFLYGSVMHIEALSRNPYTALLVYFVFPPHTLFPLGLIMIGSGLLLFLMSASQIYKGKITKKGLIKTGIYRKFRHPQYLALTICGLGFILTWGRLISFIAFFIMLWLYYLLAKGEEKNCRTLFGAEYDGYLATTYFLCPGEERLFSSFARLFPARLPAWSKIMISFVITSLLAFSSGYLIIKGKTITRNSLPVITGTYPLANHSPAAIPLLMVKGPALQAAPSDQIRNAFMARSFTMLLASPKIASALKKVAVDDDLTLLAFLGPGRNWYRGNHRNFGPVQVNAFIFCVKSRSNFTGGNFREFRQNWRITHLIRAEGMTNDRLTEGLDPTGGEVTIEPYLARMEERIDFFLSGL